MVDLAYHPLNRKVPPLTAKKLRELTDELSSYCKPNTLHNNVCPVCWGRGYSAVFEKCPACGGKGTVISVVEAVERMFLSFEKSRNL